MKMLILGLDGATWDVLTDNVLEQYLPRLYQFKKNGVSGVLRSTIPPETPAAWTTCLTGAHPQSHGLIDFQRYHFDSNAHSITNSTSIRIPGLWHYLKESDLRIASINVPFTYPTYPVKGYLVSGVGCPGRSADFTYPGDFKKKLLDTIPDYEVALGDLKVNRGLKGGRSKFADSVNRLARRFEMRLEVAQLIQKTDPVDVMFVEFQQLDMMQHNCWPYIDPQTRDQYPWHRDKIFDLYHRLDEVIGKLLDMIDLSKGLALVLSDHGFAATPYIVNVNQCLMDWGYVHRANSLSRMKRRLIRNWISFRHHRLSPYPVVMKWPVNWEKTKAMVLQRPIYGALYVNVAGRQPGGLVQPGAEYNSVLSDLKKRFSQLKNPDTGKKVFEQVVTPVELLGLKNDEDALERFGELMLIPNTGHRVSLSLSEKREQIDRTPEGAMNGAAHHPDGMYILKGQNIKSGTTVDGHIVDIAPTLYTWLRESIPSTVEGECMMGIFEKQPNVQRSRYDQPIPSLQYNISPTEVAREEEALQQQLKDLGYL